MGLDFTVSAIHNKSGACEHCGQPIPAGQKETTEIFYERISQAYPEGQILFDAISGILIPYLSHKPGYIIDYCPDLHRIKFNIDKDIYIRRLLYRVRRKIPKEALGNGMQLDAFDMWERLKKAIREAFRDYGDDTIIQFFYWG